MQKRKKKIKQPEFLIEKTVKSLIIKIKAAGTAGQLTTSYLKEKQKGKNI